MSSALSDLRFALRALRQRLGLTLLVVSTMAVGIGANVGVFAYFSYFARPTIDAPSSDELYWFHTAAKDDPRSSSSYPDWLDINRSGQELFSQFVAYRLFGASMQGPSTTLHMWGHAVSGDYFSLFGARPELGRLLQPSDDRTGAEPALVLSHLTWTRHFGSDRDIVGQTVLLDGRHAYTVVGVTRPAFQGEGIWTGIYVPLAGAGEIAAELERRDHRRVPSLARLADGVSLEEARVLLAEWARGLDEAYPERDPRTFLLVSASKFDPAWNEEPLYRAARVLMVAVSLLLLLACANVANLLLARGLSRGREMGIHAALGATRLLLARRLAFESVLMSTAGGTLGLLFARGLTKLIERYLRQDIPLTMGEWAAGTTLTLDETEVLAFTMGVSVLTGVLFGMAPALQTWRRDLVVVLKSGTGGERSQPGWRSRDILVVAQVALSVMLLVGAGLLARTSWKARDAELGFDAKDLTLAAVYFPSERVESGGIERIYDDLIQQTRRLPGVDSASLVWRAPLTQSMNTSVELVHSREQAEVNFNVVGGSYFETLAIELLRGRSFSPRDNDNAPSVVVVNESAVERYWPDTDPLGRQLRIFKRGYDEPSETFEVVGVVADSRYEPPYRSIEPLLYLPFHQRPNARMNLFVRGRGPLASQMHDLLRNHYPDLAVIALAPFEQQHQRAIAGQRMNAELSAGLGLLGLLLATFGIFSVMSYTVSRQTREIGIRVAIGAHRADVRRWVLSGTARPVGLGLALGTLGALATSRLLSSLLIGVEARDPLTFVVGLVLLASTALLAALVPAGRATRIEPVMALREF